ncbi:MAG: bi-domain-containing oxidoreductase [Nanoarchaeota archaeon]|nr:bi-domain-containing oxidoreductase [Nanoarchaeota archaeon]
MKQLFHHNMKGIVYEEFPRPVAKPGHIVVENKNSLISKGQEQALAAPQIVESEEVLKRGFKSIQKEGVKATMVKVKDRMSELTALGYSSSGIVVEQDDTGFAIGDRVACAGFGYASHGEYVLVPKNLAVRLPEKVSFEEAAFTSVGATALQGVRRLNPQLGETIAVIGLGLIGQLCCQLLNANGCNVIGIDKHEEMVLFANKHWDMEGASKDAAEFVLSKTKGNGCDGVLIAASSKDSTAINEAFHMCRKKGSVVILGDIGLELERAQLYAKELDVKVSFSYGPGRYDESYEKHGIDYPIGYVRWTERRNMEAFIELVEKKQVNLKPLITQLFPFEKGDVAYAFVEKNPSFGVLFTYSKPTDETMFHNPVKVSGQITTAVIGAGSYVKKVHLPLLKRMEEFKLQSIVTKNGLNAKETAEEYGIKQYSTDYKDVLEYHDLIMVATRNNLHAKLSIEAAKAGRAVFCERPMALEMDELKEVISAVKHGGNFYMTGFNRRFSPLVEKMLNALPKESGPTLITFRINNPLPRHDWLLDKKEGGGALLGDACNHIDMLNLLIGVDPVEVIARHTAGNKDDFVAIIKYADGSIVNLVYSVSGNDSLPQEYLELYKNKTVMVLDDFIELSINDKVFTLKKANRGRKAVLQYLSDVMTGKKKPDFGLREAAVATLTAIKIDDALKTGSAQRVETAELV